MWDCLSLYVAKGTASMSAARRLLMDWGQIWTSIRCLCVCVRVCVCQSWELSVFFNFFNNTIWYFCICYQVNNLFLHQSYLKSPLPVKLTWWKMQKIIFYYWKNLKTPKVPSSGPVCVCVCVCVSVCVHCVSVGMYIGMGVYGGLWS